MGKSIFSFWRVSPRKMPNIFIIVLKYERSLLVNLPSAETCRSTTPNNFSLMNTGKHKVEIVSGWNTPCEYLFSSSSKFERNLGSCNLAVWAIGSSDLVEILLLRYDAFWGLVGLQLVESYQRTIHEFVKFIDELANELTRFGYL